MRRFLALDKIGVQLLAQLRQNIRQNPLWVFLIIILIVGRVIWSCYLPLMDFSEARYAEIARKILENNDWITLWFKDGVPFWGKPPLAFWSVAASFVAFGVNEFASRLPSLIYTLLTGLVIYHWVKDIRDRATAVIAVTLFLTSWLVIHTAGAVITDPLLTLSTTLVMVGFWQAVVGGQTSRAYWVWLALGIGLLTKGPLALVICGGACGLWVIWHNQWRNWYQRIHLFTGLLLMLVIAVPWYYLAEEKTPGFLDYFIVGEHYLRFTQLGWTGDMYGSVKNQPHGMIWLYFVVSMLPWSFIIVARLFLKRLRQASIASLKQNYAQVPQLISYLLLWMLVPLVFFTAAQNILITYVMPALPATCILMALHSTSWIGKPRPLLIMAIVGSLIFFGIYSLTYHYYIKDHSYNQKAIVMKYLELNKKDPGPLIYWGGYRFAVVFYTDDHVLFPGPKVMEHLTDETSYHAIRNIWISSADREPIKSRCINEMYQSEYTLFYCPAIKTAEAKQP